MQEFLCNNFFEFFISLACSQYNDLQKANLKNYDLELKTINKDSEVSKTKIKDLELEVSALKAEVNTYETIRELFAKHSLHNDEERTLLAQDIARYLYDVVRYSEYRTIS
ncbi:hypothetical protein AVEN_14475-1 [Araneus ventricosus]|uniref:Uncharacterized protein n=1 Tax=Araneus ventricosus TaxID=182803 RepID=A0A4Y2K883_ARAVE|nr:hypothetical protein AVEN_14475-1 [Araneus ventricosus]